MTTNPHDIAGIQQKAEEFVRAVLVDIMGNKPTDEQVTIAATKIRTVIVATNKAWERNHR